MLRRILCFFWVSLCNCFFFLFFTIPSLRRVHASPMKTENEKSCNFYGPDDKEKQLAHNSVSDHVWESRIELSSGTEISRFVQELRTDMIVSFIVEKVFLGFSFSAGSTISTLRNVDAVKSEEELGATEEQGFGTDEENDELFRDAVENAEDSSSLEDFDSNSVLKVGSFNEDVLELGAADEKKLGWLSEAVINEEAAEIEDETVKTPIGDGGIFSAEAEQNFDGVVLANHEEESKSEQTCDDDDDDGGDLLIWEHDDIIEQLKLELKLTRTGGLPTIIEEVETELESCSSPDIQMAGDPKPMNYTVCTEQKVQQILEQIQKVHRMYGEKMRELDVLNYRTMHAIGLIQMKDHTLRSNPAKKSRNFLLPCLRRKKVWPELMISMASMIYEDLETVYIGQMCLSWEILHWQYRKACNLLQIHQSTSCNSSHNHPRRRYHFYNHVADAKKRCIVDGILQVPAIRSDNDCLIGKEHENGASITELVSIIEESIHDLWCFICSDKAAADNDVINNRKAAGSASIQHQQGSAADSTLFMAVRTLLHKKKRRLKDIVRSSNCIVKKHKNKKKKQQEQVNVIIAQIQLKLISRVLRMQKLTTYRLLWCRHKLDQTTIDVRSSNIYYVEEEEDPSFMLFPF